MSGFGACQLSDVSNTQGADVKEPAQPPQPTDFTRLWQNAFEAEDYAALRDMYEPDAWLMTQGQATLKGVDDIVVYLKALREKGMTSDVKTDVENQFTDGHYSFSSTNWWVEYPRENGELFRDSGRSFVVFKRGLDGKWRLWRAMKNQSPQVLFKDVLK